MDNYQAVYDAVRSKFGNVDAGRIYETIRGQFDVSYGIELIKQDFLNVAYEMQRPSVLYKPSISIDGNQWCALYGENLQNGVAGFGDSPAMAMLDFDNQWRKKLEDNNA